jgi:hypothetical protein
VFTLVCLPAQALTCLQAGGGASLGNGASEARPRRNTNYAPPSASRAPVLGASGVASGGAAAPTSDAEGVPAAAASSARTGTAAPPASGSHTW